MVWDRLFPDLTQRKEAILVYGIGTPLDGRHDRVDPALPDLGQL